MTGRRAAKPAKADDALDTDGWPVSGRPGFLIRRLHQIHVALFIEECGSEFTPVQYSVLSAVAAHGPSDQKAIGQIVGLDRANIADVLARLEKRGLVRRRVSPADGRVRLAALSAEGRKALAHLDAGAIRAHERTIETLPSAARQQFLAALARLVAAKNDVGRAILRLSPEE